mmetsp:Transcript_37621/g.60375  ORF Transcript_37621/g.60375 Transcript_37621/m.60375 type:complete len:104 (+) Transcript_37621:89-400(+)
MAANQRTDESDLGHQSLHAPTSTHRAFRRERDFFMRSSRSNSRCILGTPSDTSAGIILFFDRSPLSSSNNLFVVKPSIGSIICASISSMREEFIRSMFGIKSA